ncbi:MAG: UDP-N-acetylglucosamine 2-epimerase (non-hydrolyzing) [Deltaproteobacteria bacterium]|nr:UDP-N-acetylglucosamine 2-epimerase (non-hydrolyzing) [Deltaproteobacteria bacterium]
MRPRNPIVVVIGTRPEYIKLAPLVLCMRRNRMPVRVIFTGQHRELLDDVKDAFDVDCDRKLQVFKPGQRPGQMLARMVQQIEQELRDCEARFVVVQGDTCSALGGALAATQLQIPVGHVEAGLRTEILFSPFPEEANRRLISAISSLHFCATKDAAQNLVREGVVATNIAITGNTVVDAVYQTLRRIPFSAVERRERILVTMHRRENVDSGIENVARAIKRLVQSRPNLEVRWILHRNPKVRSKVTSILATERQVHLLEPLSYQALLSEMKRAKLLLTDSGGLQEEAPALNLPVGILRGETEREEGVKAGCALLLGVEENSIVQNIHALLNDEKRLQSMSRAKNPFGDGRACQRIAWILCHRLGLPFLEEVEQTQNSQKSVAVASCHRAYRRADTARQIRRSM